jgi:hypothetical protein
MGVMGLVGVLYNFVPAVTVYQGSSLVQMERSLANFLLILVHHNLHSWLNCVDRSSESLDVSGRDTGDGYSAVLGGVNGVLGDVISSCPL